MLTFQQRQTPFQQQHPTTTTALLSTEPSDNVTCLFTSDIADFSTTSNAFPTAIVGQRQQQIQLKESRKVVTRTFPLPEKGEGFQREALTRKNRIGPGRRREKKKASQSEVIRTIADPTKLLRRRLGSA